MQPKKDTEFIKDLVKMGEGTKLEFKKEITNLPKIAKTLVAFSNTQGGRLLIGIDDHGLIVGIDADEEMYMLEKANRELCVPPVTLSYEMYEMDHPEDFDQEGPLILLVNVAHSQTKHSFKDKKGTLTPYLRIAAQNMPENQTDRN